ncbi:MAG: V-type ATPase subunit [Candidatus Hodarchaeota archaeon]
MLIKPTRDYSFINAKIRALKAQLLTIGEYERLLSAQSLNEVARLIGTTSYANSEIGSLLKNEPIDLNEIDRFLSKYYYQFTEYLMSWLPKYARGFTELAYGQKMFITGLKSIIRGIHFHINKKEIVQYLIAPDEEVYKLFRDLLDSATVAELIDRLPDPESQKLLHGHLREYEALKSPLILEQALTKRYYDILFQKRKTLRRIDVKSVFRIVNAEIDLFNLAVIIRAKNLDLEENTIRSWLIPIQYKLGSIEKYLKSRKAEIFNLLNNTVYRELAPAFQTAFETEIPHFEVIDTAIDQFLVHLAYISFREVPFHLGVFSSFLHLKSMEIRNLRAIITGKHDGVESNLIRRFLTII